MRHALRLALALGLAGCAAEPPARSCATDDECGSAQVCRDARCVDAPRFDAGSPRDAAPPPGPDAQRADVVCSEVEQEARVIVRPIDAIVLPDESASMGPARDAVAAAMETTFRTTMDAATVDYRVIWHGTTPLPMLEATGRVTRNPVGLGSGDDAMFKPVLDTYDSWRPALRADAIKVFVHFTDATSGTGAAIVGYSGTFDEVLVAREPDVWGTAGDYRFVYHAFVGLPINSPPEAPYAPSAPIASGTCSGSFVNPTTLQQIAIRTGGLRFPLCSPERFDAVFRAIAESAIERAAVPCELELPEPPAGMTLDLSTLAVRYRSGAATRVLRRASSAAECNDASFLLVDDARVVLCPEACAVVEADPMAALTVLSGCNPDLY